MQGGKGFIRQRCKGDWRFGGIGTGYQWGSERHMEKIGGWFENGNEGII